MDPRTGNELPGSFTETEIRAYLAQQPVTVLSAASEYRGGQNTVMSTHTVLVPPSVDLRPESELVDDEGTVYRVAGAVAERRGLGTRILFKAATARVVSDLGATE